MIVGEKIRTRREELGWTQDELAEKMGYKSRSTIAKIEKGVNDVTQKTLIKFAKTLGTTTSYLLGWEDDKSSRDSVVPHMLIFREDNSVLNLAEVFREKKHMIAPIVSLMCADEEFLNAVWDFASLDDEHRAIMGKLITSFKEK